MQPYILPYIGYFQLIAASDKFLLYDDVQYIKQGWINRNRLLESGESSYFNIQLVGASSNKMINEVEVNADIVWRNKLLKRLKLVYGKSEYFKDVYPVVDVIINNKANNLSEYLFYSVQCMTRFLGINTPIQKTSHYYDNSNLKGQARIIDICRQEGATKYLNAYGGSELYEGLTFENSGIDLFFLSPLANSSKISKLEMYLSIVHLLFQYGPEVVTELIHQGDIRYWDERKKNVFF